MFQSKFVQERGGIESYFVDNKGYSSVMKRALSKNDELEKTILDAYYSDYREINGMKILFMVSCKFKDQNILKITNEKVEINVKVNDSIFKFSEN